MITKQAVSSLLLLFLITAHAKDRNVALHKPAFMSSNMHHCPGPSITTNGDLRLHLPHQPCRCAQTSINDGNGWWIVDLQEIHEVAYINLTNRYEQPNYLTNIELRVGNEKQPHLHRNKLCHRITVRSKTTRFDCPAGLSGRYVSIQRTGYERLVLCEIQVFATVQSGKNEHDPLNKMVMSKQMHKQKHKATKGSSKQHHSLLNKMDRSKQISKQTQTDIRVYKQHGKDSLNTWEKSKQMSEQMDNDTRTYKQAVQDSMRQMLMLREMIEERERTRLRSSNASRNDALKTIYILIILCIAKLFD